VTRRPSICYAAPGQLLLTTAGPTRNVLSVAEALSESADVTLAFRSLAEPINSRRYQVLSIEDAPTPIASRDDVTVRGLNPLIHARYLRTLRRFARRAAREYDIVLEKGWRFSGYLAHHVKLCGGLSALIENDVRFWNEPVGDIRALARFLAQRAAQSVAARCSRSVPLIIAETEELKEALVDLRGVEAGRIAVVELGVDHDMFRPMEQEGAREKLGIDRDVLVLLYVGGLDLYHDLGQVIQALARAPSDKRLELHVVGDGHLRSLDEQSAQRLGVAVRFHGQVAHDRVPVFIAAADLCLAPYQPNRFYGGRITFSTLKIPEYMACERPVASVPHGHILRLIDDHVTGFLVDNQADAWLALLQGMPSRARLAEMGRSAARRVASLSWRATAARYLDLSLELRAQSASEKTAYDPVARFPDP
jgi:glycosyltransferase involved in cell wall biosynthesis